MLEVHLHGGLFLHKIITMSQYAIISGRFEPQKQSGKKNVLNLQNELQMSPLCGLSRVWPICTKLVDFVSISLLLRTPKAKTVQKQLYIYIKSPNMVKVHIMVDFPIKSSQLLCHHADKFEPQKQKYS